MHPYRVEPKEFTLHATPGGDEAIPGQRGIGPRWARFNGCGRLYITVAEARRFLRSAIAPSAQGLLS